jgi:hypothetical protein
MIRVSARTQRMRRLAPEADPERFEVCEVAPGRRGRVLATAATRAGARLALRTLVEEGELALAIRDAATGRWLAR